MNRNQITYELYYEENSIIHYLIILVDLKHAIDLFKTLLTSYIYRNKYIYIRSQHSGARNTI